MRASVCGFDDIVCVYGKFDSSGLLNFSFYHLCVVAVENG